MGSWYELAAGALSQSTARVEAGSQEERDAKIMKITVAVVLALLVGIAAGWSGHSFWNQLTTPKVDEKIFDNVSRASKAVDSAAKVGVSYQKFAELVQNFATEISVAKDKVKSQQETEILQGFGDVLQIYNDALILWTEQISTDQQMFYFDDRGKIAIFAENARVLDIGKKYVLRVERVKLMSGLMITTLPKTAVSEVLGKAHARVEEANALLFGKKP
jgi:hypothetical protein